MNEPHYHINLFWSAEDECWIADVPDLRPCSAHGDTRAEAIANINRKKNLRKSMDECF